MFDIIKALSDTKLLLGDADATDAVLRLIINDCVNRILGYCKIEVLPESLYTLIPVMAVRSYHVGGFGRADPKGQVIKIEQGQRSVWYDGGDVTRDDWLNDFKERLEPFRNRRGRLPSEI